jgi:hydrogenase maturation protease
MGASIATEASFRLLGLGNEILADDAFGILAAREAERRFGNAVDVVTSSAAGFHLMDEMLGATRLVVVDTIQTGLAKPGAISVLNESQVQTAPGGSPHFMGLFDVLRTARGLGLAAPSEVSIIAVEASDCLTVGGAMHPDVEAAIGPAVDLAWQLLTGSNR